MATAIGRATLSVLKVHSFFVVMMMLSAGKYEQMKNFQGIKICLYLPFKCLSGFELYSRWVPL